MRYLPIYRFNQERLNQTAKQKVWYNPDGNVAIFEEGDESVWGYITKYGAKLKDQNFSMNDENYGKILHFLATDPDEQPKREETSSSGSIEGKKSPILTEEETKEIEEIYDGDVTLKKARRCIEIIYKALSR